MRTGEITAVDLGTGQGCSMSCSACKQSWLVASVEGCEASALAHIRDVHGDPTPRYTHERRPLPPMPDIMS